MLHKLLLIILCLGLLPVFAGVTETVTDYKFHKYKDPRTRVVVQYQKQISKEVLIWNAHGKLYGTIFNSGRVLKHGKAAGYVSTFMAGLHIFTRH